jgi:hypothetical protein
MWRRLRSIAVVAAVILGLFAQVIAVPAMAASVVKSECAMAHGKCPMPGTTKHLGMQPCQPPCVIPGMLLGPQVVAIPIVWARHLFATRAAGLPPGLNPAPDPYPPRSPALA